MKAMNYVVTGASGFAGMYLVQALAGSGHRVTGLVRMKGSLKGSPANEIVGDLLDQEAVSRAIKRANPDGIFHLAAPQTSVGRSWEDPVGTIRDNLASTLHVLEASHGLAKPAKVLYVSSAEVLGDVAKQPMNETLGPHPESPYAVSKQAGEAAGLFYAEHRQVPVVIVRPFNHIGPGQRPSFVLPSFAGQIAAIEPRGRGEIRVGNLSAKRDFTDVRDMVDAYMLLMEKGQSGETYHVGSGKARPIKELLEFLISASPAKINVVADDALFRPTDIAVMQSDSSKIRKLGWKPQYTLKQTLSEILEEARA